MEYTNWSDHIHIQIIFIFHFSHRAYSEGQDLQPGGAIEQAAFDMVDNVPLEPLAAKYAEKIEAAGVGKIPGGALPGLK